MSNELQLSTKHIDLLPVGLKYNCSTSEIPPEEWQAVLDKAVLVNVAHQWWIGDVVNDCPWGEKKKWCEERGISYGTARNYASIAAQYSLKDRLSTRVDNLSHHHARVAAQVKDKELRDKLLDDAAKEKLSANELKRRIDNLDSIAERRRRDKEEADRRREEREQRSAEAFMERQRKQQEQAPKEEPGPPPQHETMDDAWAKVIGDLQSHFMKSLTDLVEPTSKEEAYICIGRVLFAYDNPAFTIKLLKQFKQQLHPDRATGDEALFKFIAKIEAFIND